MSTVTAPSRISSTRLRALRRCCWYSCSPQSSARSPLTTQRPRPPCSSRTTQRLVMHPDRFTTCSAVSPLPAPTTPCTPSAEVIAACQQQVDDEAQAVQDRLEWDQNWQHDLTGLAIGAGILLILWVAYGQVQLRFTPCSACRKRISRKALTCPHCQTTQQQPSPPEPASRHRS